MSLGSQNVKDTYCWIGIQFIYTSLVCIKICVMNHLYFSRKETYIYTKLAWLVVIMFCLSASHSWGQYFVNFEGSGETNGSYDAATVSLSGTNWSIGPEALIGDLGNDWKNGSRSLRLRARNGSLASMTANKTNGIGTISFSYRRYGTDGSQQPYAVEYSTNNGSSWTQIGSNITGTADVQTFNQTVNVTGNIRIRFRLTTSPGTSGDRRLNIDDINITDYTGVPTPSLTASTPTLSGFNYVQGSGPSGQLTYTLSGTDLVGSGNIVVTAPTNYQVSLTSGSGFANSINVPFASGIVTGQPRTIYVRLNAGLNAQCASYSGNITHTGGGATAINVAVQGTVSATLLPPLHNLSSSNFTFTTWANSSQCRTYPTNMRLWRTASILTSASTANPTANYEGAYNLSSASRISGQGANGVSFVATGSEGAGIPFGAAVGLNTTGRENIQVSWLSRMVSQGDGATPREFRLRLQYRVGSGSWVAVSGPVEYTSSGKTNGSSQTLTGTLPSACDNQAEVYVRWVYYEAAANSGGSRPEIGLDDITISSSPLSPATITTGTSVTGAPFTMSNCTSTHSGSISYTIGGSTPFVSGNVFTAELSDASGSFAQPLAIGSVTSTSAGSISITIPENLATGTGYRIRVVGSDPETTGSQSNAFTITQNGAYCPQVGDFQTRASGTWASTGTWHTYNYVAASKSRVWQNATIQPNNANLNVYVRNGHTVTLSDGPKSVNHLVIDNGGRLYRNNTSCANLQYVNLGGDLLCNGNFGNGTTSDAIGLNIQVGAHTIHGSGSFNAHRIRLSDEDNNNALRGSATLTIDMDVTLRYNPSSCTGGFNAIYSNRTASETFDVIINSGRTLTISDPTASIGMDGANNPPTVYPGTDRGGGYTVFGTIICEGYYMLGSNNTPANRKPYMRIKNGGLVRVAYLDFGDNNVASGGELTIENGGTLEITGASSGNSWLNTGVGSINFTVQSGSLIKYNSNSNQSIPGNLFTYNNLTKSGTGTLNLSSNLTVEGNLTFEDGIIATGANDLIVSNSSAGAIVGANTSGSTKFVNGRLIRNTNNAVYFFPVGNPTYGVQGFTIDVTGSGNVLGFVENNTTAPLVDRAYCDIETTDAVGSQIGQGTAGPDGFLDQMIFDLSSPLQWNVTNPGGGVTSYDITVNPNGANDIEPVMAMDGTEIRFLLKNGEPGNGGVPTGNVPDEFDENGFLACPNGYTLTGMTSFSTFTINGSTGANTQLPIELLYFNAVPKNRVVSLIWKTASELNNDFFTVQRSQDGFTWEDVLQIDGAGTTTLHNNYSEMDMHPYSGVSYYRLKQTDFDGQFSYSNIVSVVIDTEDKQLVKAVNILGQEVELDAKGMVILIFSNGESLKRVNE